MLKNYAIILVLLFAALTSKAQETPVLIFNTPTQNNLQFNRFLMNPTFSFVRNSDSHITLYNRNQWIQFDNAPQLFMGTYSGQFGEKSGAGIGLYQQNSGIISSYGAIANYAYYVPFQEKIGLTLGFNLAYYSSGINRNKTITNDPDPLILALGNVSLVTLNPGLNLTWNRFDFGVYAENLVDYNFKSSALQDDLSEKTFSSTLSYHYDFSATSGSLENASLRFLARGSYNKTDEISYGGSLLSNFPSLGWLQGGYDEFYGVGVGGGVHLSKRVSVGYVYEKGLQNGVQNFGPTHEITIAFRFPSKENSTAATATSEVEKKPTIASKPATIEPKKESSFDQNIAVEKLRLEMNEKHEKLLQMIAAKDSTEVVTKEDFEKRVANLQEYIQREEKAAAKKEEKAVDTKKATSNTKSTVAEIPAKKKTETSVRETTAFAKNTEQTATSSAMISTNTIPSGMTDLEIEQRYNSSNVIKRPLLLKGNRIDIDNMEAGFYLVANIYAKPAQAEDFLNELKLLGIYGNYFINPKNNYRYVYIKMYKTWDEALIAYYSNVNNTYYDKLWIMNININ